MVDKIEPEDFMPYIIKDDIGVGSGKISYGLMMVELKKCSSCGKYMLEVPYSRPFPWDRRFNLKSQLEKSGWVRESSSLTVKDICEECVSSGKAVFKCTLCGNTYQSNEVRLTFGYKEDFLCRSCYKTVPAARWEREVSRLTRKHDDVVSEY